MSRTKILVVAAHPDDETLGCGGTMARHAAEGHEVHVLFLTNGVGARGADDAAAMSRHQAAANALANLNVTRWRDLSLPDNALDSVPLLDVVRPIEQYLREYPAQIIYTHHGGDLNIDHELAHRAVMTACRPQPGFCVKRICTFEVPSSTGWSGSDKPAFRPNHFINIENYWPQKLAALQAYAMEMRASPHARSLAGVEALNVWRGVSVGVSRAEAFFVERDLWV